MNYTIFFLTSLVPVAIFLISWKTLFHNLLIQTKFYGIILTEIGRPSSDNRYKTTGTDSCGVNNM